MSHKFRHPGFAQSILVRSDVNEGWVVRVQVGEESTDPAVATDEHGYASDDRLERDSPKPSSRDAMHTMAATRKSDARSASSLV